MGMLPGRSSGKTFRERMPSKGLCDMHCHLVPGVDDGVQTREEAMDVLREEYRQCVRRVIITPHYHPGRYRPTVREIREAVSSLQQQCQAEGLGLRLYPGQECYYFSGLVELLDRGEVLTMANTRYVLTEFDPDCMFSMMQGGLRELEFAGYHPILAHFERYQCLRNREQLVQLKEQGVLLQMNFDTLLKKDTFLHRNPWRELAEEGVIDFLGSDTHGMNFRPPHIREAYTWIRTNVEEPVREKILYGNIEKIIKKRGT